MKHHKVLDLREILDKVEPALEHLNYQDQFDPEEVETYKEVPSHGTGRQSREEEIIVDQRR